MKLTFSFTDSPDIEKLPADEIYHTYFEIPDEAKHLLGYEQRIQLVAESVGKLSDACVFLSCKELAIKRQPIKVEFTSQRGITTTVRVATACFQRRASYDKTRKLKILLPIESPVVLQLMKQVWFNQTSWCRTQEDIEYHTSWMQISDQLLMLLNAEPPQPPYSRGWESIWFSPSWPDNGLIGQHQRRSKKRLQAERKREREEAKKAKQQATAKVKVHPSTGAGRRGGAIPGKFAGVQFRSQLEIRFATQLAERGIQWAYESERLGEGNYLVDFYLPDLQAWVEVKGRFEPRDHFLLKEVSSYLTTERGHQLFVFTQSRGYLVTADEFQEFKHNEFWIQLLMNRVEDV